MQRFDVAKHHAEPVYVGCPHCEGPVNVEVQVHEAMAKLATVLMARVEDPDLKSALERFVAECSERAWPGVEVFVALRA